MKDDIYPLTIIKDRYTGAYSGGNYTAWNLDHSSLPDEITGDDISCAHFWQHFPDMELKNEWKEKVLVGLGKTPNDAVKDLESKISK